MLVSSPQPVWLPPYWCDRAKHVPPAGAGWQTVVQLTGRSNAPAVYHPGVSSAAERERLEMECVRLTQPFAVRGITRLHFMEFGDVIGASTGEETKFVYAEYHISGVVHGRPITRDELRR